MFMKEELNYIFGNVNEWLKFAEAKNAALIAFDSGLIAGAISLLMVDKPLPVIICCYGWFAVALLAVSCFVCMLSFLPQVVIKKRCPPPVTCDR